MKQVMFTAVLLLLIGCSGNAQQKKSKKTTKKTMAKIEKIVKTDAEWQAQLSPQEYYVLRQKGTDRPGDGGYTKLFEKGTYHCRACNLQLFESVSKYESHCGWPSFDDAIEGTVLFTPDYSHGMIRTEITCARCEGHLGHIFDDGPKDTTGKRYCVNTSSIKFVKSEK